MVKSSPQEFVGFDYQSIFFSGHKAYALPLKLSTKINFASYSQGKRTELAINNGLLASMIATWDKTS